MLLAVDVGNTNVTIGVFDGAEMVTRVSFYGSYFQNLGRIRKYNM